MSSSTTPIAYRSLEEAEVAAMAGPDLVIGKEVGGEYAVVLREQVMSWLLEKPSRRMVDSRMASGLFYIMKSADVPVYLGWSAGGRPIEVYCPNEAEARKYVVGYTTFLEGSKVLAVMALRCPNVAHRLVHVAPSGQKTVCL